eukprot:TRINITY_DN2905_c0_g2_i1.p1 TRINITY_DN2905_c0_g2~~TRINITY_DN2905_c0_g2_i1.p1  ORF type:complete len:437 (-),score=74.16 TRINITY_DN2905_c0_g2_i1:63-1373(-)
MNNSRSSDDLSSLDSIESANNALGVQSYFKVWSRSQNNLIVHSTLLGCYQHFVTPEELFALFEERLKEGNNAYFESFIIWMKAFYHRDFLGKPLYDQVLALAPRLDEYFPVPKGAKGTLQGFSKSNQLKLTILKIAQQASAGNSEAFLDLPKLQDFNEQESEQTQQKNYVSFFLLVEDSLIVQFLTSIESAMFRNVESFELINLNWRKRRNKHSQVNAMFKRFNNVSTWFCFRILSEKKSEGRADLIAKLIDIADQLIKTGNYNTLMEILAALNMHPVDRLKRTWQKVPERYLERREKMQELMDPRNNYKAYRAELAQRKETKQYSLPYFGIFTRDLTFIEEGNETKLENGKCNTEKISLTAKVLEDIRYWQHYTFSTKFPSAETENFFRNIQGIEEEVLDKLSQKREPIDGSASSFNDSDSEDREIESSTSRSST